MSSRLPVTLQVNVSPADYPFVLETIPHQLRQLSAFVDEVLLTFDLRRSPVSFSQEWEDNRPLTRDLLHKCRRDFANVRIEEVDYSPRVDEELGRLFLGRRPVPHVDARGGPFYPYLYGIQCARHAVILHLDAVMLVGGSFDGWIEPIAALLESRRDLAGISPALGPPRADGLLRPSYLKGLAGWCRPDVITPRAYAFDKLSLRAVLIHRENFMARVGPLPLKLAAPLHVLGGWAAGHPPYRDLEVSISQAMQKRGLARLAMAGPPPGFWTLQPLVRSATLPTRLPGIIRAIESKTYPDDQCGDGQLRHEDPGWDLPLKAA